MRIRDIITEDDKFDIGAGISTLIGKAKAGYDLMKSGIEEYNTEIRDEKKKAKDEAQKLSSQRKAKISQVITSTLNQFIDSYADVANANVTDLQVDDRPIQQKLIEASETREQLMVAALAYRDLGKTLLSISEKLDKEAGKLKNKASEEELAKIKKMNKASVNNAGVELVKKHRDYFKRLIKVNNEFVLDEKTFITLLNTKMMQTTPTRKLEALMLVSSIIKNMATDLNDIAVMVAKEAEKKPSEKTNTEKK